MKVALSLSTDVMDFSNSLKSISPSPFSSADAMIWFHTSSVLPLALPLAKTAYNSARLMAPLPSASNILNAACRFSELRRSSLLKAAAMNSV